MHGVLSTESSRWSGGTGTGAINQGGISVKTVKTRALWVMCLTTLLVVAFCGAASAQYELPADNPFTPHPGSDVIAWNSGLGAILAVLFGWAAKNVIGPALVVYGGWRLFEVVKDGLKSGHLTHALTAAGYILGGIMIVLLVSSGNWYELIRSIWASISGALTQIGNGR